MLLESGTWRIHRREVLTRWGIPSELLVASPANRQEMLDQERAAAAYQHGSGEALGRP
jgi:uncharacterized circularly permuted ATP-grasp superfamily protein